jgi:hypothetical protein
MVDHEPNRWPTNARVRDNFLVPVAQPQEAIQRARNERLMLSLRGHALSSVFAVIIDVRSAEGGTKAEIPGS